MTDNTMLNSLLETAHEGFNSLYRIHKVKVTDLTLDEAVAIAKAINSVRNSLDKLARLSNSIQERIEKCPNPDVIEPIGYDLEGNAVY